MLYSKVELDDGVEVQYLGAYVLKWKDGHCSEPEVGFVETGEYDVLLEEHKALQELLAMKDVEIEELRTNLGGHVKANRQLKEDLRLESAAYKGLRLRLEEEMERFRELGVKLVRAHRMLVDDLNALWPVENEDVEALKAKLLQDVREYCDGL